jgi:DNA-directed RNA polymerase subunit RPC12/RpoP
MSENIKLVVYECIECEITFGVVREPEAQMKGVKMDDMTSFCPECGDRIGDAAYVSEYDLKTATRRKQA